MPLALEARGLIKHFTSRANPFGKPRVVRAVDGVDLKVAQGETLAIVGESGCGKSTLGRLLVGLMTPNEGSLWFDGKLVTGLDAAKMRPLRAQVQMIFQDPFAALNPRARAGDIIGEPLVVHGIGTPVEQAARVAQLLNLTGLRPEQARWFPHVFSGGQRQRIAIARALATAPRVIIADEPVSALDVSIQAQILNLLQELKHRLGLTMVFISHDLAAVHHVSDQVAVMYLGQIVEMAPAGAMFVAARHPYTQALMQAIPTRDPAHKSRRVALRGEMPSAANPPPGCRFHTRCPFADAQCRVSMPHLADQGDGHFVACHYAESIAPLNSRALAPVVDSATRNRRLAIYTAALAKQARFEDDLHLAH